MFQYEGQQYTEEEVKKAAEIKGLSLDDYIENFNITKTEEPDPVKKSTTPPDAGVETDKASDMVSPSEDGSLEYTGAEPLEEYKATGSEFIDEGGAKLRQAGGGEFDPLQLEGVTVTAEQINNEIDTTSTFLASDFIKLLSPAGRLLALNKASDAGVEFLAGGKEGAEKSQQMKNEDIAVGRSIYNTLVNGINQFSGLDEQFGYMGAYIVQDQDIMKNLLGEKLGGKLAKKNREGVFKYFDNKLTKINSLGLQTINFTDLTKRNKQIYDIVDGKKVYKTEDTLKNLGSFANMLGGGVAAALDGIGSFATSAAIYAGTGGSGLFAQMASQSIKTANDVKAKSLGITTEQLLNRNQGEFIRPLGLATIGFSLERFGIKNVQNYINTMSPGGVKGLFSLMSVGGKEGGTEWTQGIIEEFNKLLSEGLSNKEAMEKAWEYGQSPEGRENFYKGFIGAQGSGLVASYFKARANIRTSSQSSRIAEDIKAFASLEDQKTKRNLSREEIVELNKTQVKIKERLTSTLNENDQVIAALTEDQIELINISASNIQENQKKISETRNFSKNLSPEARKNLIKDYQEEINVSTQVISDIRNTGERIIANIDKTKEVGKLIEGVEVRDFANAEEINTFIEEQGLQNVDKKASEEQAFIIQNPNTKQQTIIINRDQSARDRSVTQGFHEAGHALLYKTIQDNPETALNLKNALKKEIDAIDADQVKDSKFKSRLEQYKNETEEVQAEEYLTLFSEALLSGDIKFEENIQTKIGDIVRRGLQALGVKVKFDTGRDVYNFLKDFNKSVEKGTLSVAQIELAREGATGELVAPKTEQTDKQTTIKDSKKIVDEFKQMKNEDLVETINMLDSDPTSRSNAIEALIDKNPIIYQALGYNPAKGDVVPADMRTAIEDELLGTEKGKGRGILKTFNPENSKFSTYLQNVFSRRKEQVYKRAGLDDKKFQTSSLSDERVREAVSQETEEQPSTQQDISPKSITRNKIALAADKTGINETNTPGVIKEISNVVKPILDKLDPTSPTFRQNFDTEAGKALKPLVKKLIGRDYAGFIQRNMPRLLKNLDMKYLVDADAGRGVFARFNKRLTKQVDIDKAVDKGLAYVDPTKKAQGVNLYDRTTLTPQQAKNYYITNNTPSTTSNKRGKLEEAIGNRLAKDISMEISKDKAPQDRKNISEKLQVPIDLKFSKSIKRAINSIPSSKQQEVQDKFGIFAQGVKKGYSVDAAINQVYGFLNPKQKELFAKLIKPELNKIIVNQKDLETGKPKEIDIVKFLTDALDEITQKEVVKKTLGLESGSLNFKNKEQLYGYFNLIDQFIDSKIKNMNNDFDKAFYIVNTFAPTLTAAAKVSDGSLTWKTINNLPTLINKKIGKEKESLRYSLFANNGQMGEVLIKPFLKNPELLVFKNSQLLYNGKKLFNPRVSQTVSPALTSIKKNGKLSDDLLNKSQAYAEQNTNTVIELATFFKKLKDTDAGLNMNDFGMFLQGANGDMSAMIRAAAKLDSVAGLNDNLSLDPKKWRFEHNSPARTMQVHLANYIQGNITEAQLRKEFDNYTVSIIPKLMDDVINERYQDTSPLDATSKWQRYYNEYSFGRFPYVTTVYKPMKDGKYTTEEFGKFAPAAYKSVQAAEVKNKKELEPVFKFSKSTPVDNQQVLDKMAEVDNKNVSEELKFSKSIDLNKDMNDIIEAKTGIASEKTYSRVKAEVVGANKGRFDFFIPPSAEDFTGLLYKTLSKSKLGDSQMAWYKAHLLNPFARAMDNISRDRVALQNDFKALKKELKGIPKTLKKKVPGEGFTQEQAVRSYIWDKQGMTIPGLAGTDIKTLVDFVAKNPDLVTFADQLIAMQKGDQYAAPGEGWLAGNITTDLMEGINTTKRAKYLEVWQTNADQIFSEANLSKLEAAYGKDYRVALENSLQRMKTGKNRSFGGDSLTGRVTDWLTNSIGAIMFFNTRSAVLQTISAINFINFGDNNVYAAGKAFANQKQYWKDFKTLFNSDFLLERRDGLKLNVNEADIADMAKRGGVRGVISELLRLGFLPTQLADSFAIAAGGSTFYRNRLKALEKQGMSKTEAEAKAFQDFRETAEESQQSSRPDRISQQQAGPLGRVILAFANTPAQYARIIKKAASDLKNRRGDDKTNVSKILYYGVAQNLIFNALQQALFGLAFGDDEEELTEKEKNKKEKRYVNVANGMADSLLRGMGLGGAVFSVLKNTALRLNQEADKKSPKYQDVLVKEILQISPPISSKVGKLRAAGRSYSWNKEEMMTKGWSIDNPAYLAAGQVIAATTNIPLDRAFKKIDNIRNASNSDLEAWQRVASAAGWSAWELGIEKGKTSSVELTDEQKLIKLTKKQQVDSLLTLGISKKQINNLKLESDRVQAILNPKSIKKEKVSEVDSLMGLNKKQQVSALLKLGFTKKQIRALKLESERVSAIIRKKK